MDTVTYPDARVADMVQRDFIPVRVKVKEDRQLTGDYLVTWTPNVVVADERGRVHYRIEGYVPPEEFMARLALGLGRFRFNRGQFDRARERFEEVARRHGGTDAGAEAQYWLGVTRYKESHDPAQLRPSWDQLARDYPESAWSKRAQIPVKS
jgi:tetratricopeptide (TPR) repeat protein